jgi:hypothetical protein
LLKIDSNILVTATIVRKRSLLRGMASWVNLNPLK